MGKGYWQPTPCRSVHSTGSFNAWSILPASSYCLEIAEILLRILDSLSELLLFASLSKSELVDMSYSLLLLFPRFLKSSTVVRRYR